VNPTTITTTTILTILAAAIITAVAHLDSTTTRRCRTWRATCGRCGVSTTAPSQLRAWIAAARHCRNRTITCQHCHRTVNSIAAHLPRCTALNDTSRYQDQEQPWR